MSSPRTGILSLIRFNWGGGLCDFSIIPSPNWTFGFGTSCGLGLGLGLGGLKLVLRLDNYFASLVASHTKLSHFK